MKLPPHILLPAVAAFGAVLLAAGCHRESAAPASHPGPPVEVRILKVEATPHPATEDVVGTVRPKLRARVEAKLSSRIEEVFVEPGQRVEQGAPLATLDAREVEARLDQARALLAQSDKDFQRLQPLLQSNAISKQDYDAAEARLRVSKSSVVEVETMLTYTRITAPFPGIITRKLADVGDLAMPGKALFEIESPVTLRFEADVPEALIDRIEMGQTLPVSLNAIAEPLTGTVAEIAPIADSGSRTYLVKLELPPVKGLRAGQFGRLKVTVGESRVPLVPANSVMQHGQMELVWVAENGHARLRIVKTGKRLKDRVEIISGLEAGETVIVDGGNAISDGQPVEVMP